MTPRTLLSTQVVSKAVIERGEVHKAYDIIEQSQKQIAQAKAQKVSAMMRTSQELMTNV